LKMDEIAQQIKADYDAVAYESWTHEAAHPERLALVATLRGLSPPPVNNCRLLDIGCAAGSNLLPLAEQLPKSQFVGIDFSSRQIDVGNQLIRELGLTNVKLRCQDLMDFPENSGTFDYIIAHGFYSWVPEPVRQQLLRVCRRHLAPRGLAYISYNIYPGWRLTSVIRDMMLYHARNATNPADRAELGRQMIRFVAEQSLGPTYYREMISEFQKAIASQTDNYLLHDHMGVVNDPVYFREFVQETAKLGLHYVGDAVPTDDLWHRMPRSIQETVEKASADGVEREQYLDLLMNRSFRQSVFCAAEAAEVIRGRPADQIRRLYIAGHPSDTPAGTDPKGRAIHLFKEGEYKLQYSDPSAIAVLRRLSKAWPSAAPFAELLAVAQAQLSDGQIDAEKNANDLAKMIEMCFGLGLVELWTRPPTYISQTGGQYPRSTRLARWQAANRHWVTSLRHKVIQADDAVRLVLPLLDGTRDRQALAEELVRRNSAAQTGRIASIRDVQSAKRLLDRVLPQLANLSLLLHV
jgi:SAM-dependent methyltransferase